MNEQINELKNQLDSQLSQVASTHEIENIRVAYLGKNGSITELLKKMGGLSPEEKKNFGQAVNVLKGYATQAIANKIEELNKIELERELNSLPEIDLSVPTHLVKGSYHPITLVQRHCENVFRTMGFNIEDYSEVVTDYECFEALNIPKFHPARDMQDTYYLENGQLLKSHMLWRSLCLESSPCMP